jgi:small subunit ribosomal protein S13
MQKLEQVIKNPSNFGIPGWALNRRRDPEHGKDVHLTEVDLDMQKKFDVQRYIDLKSYRGFRHMFGLPVRGQHTRSSFRKGRVVGVIRKSALPTTAAGAAATKEKKGEAPAAQAAKKEEKKEAK